MLKRFLRRKPIKLGRWERLKDKNLEQIKIDLANCDSCGVCGKKEIKNTQKLILLPENDIVIW